MGSHRGRRGSPYRGQNDHGEAGARARGAAWGPLAARRWQHLPMSREVFRHLAFPFPDDVFPDELGAVVQQTVLDGSMPAILVVHTDENSWLVETA
jgi:hypothetical protein